MYGVPADLDLTHYANATCIQVTLGECQIQLHFHPTGTIAIDGRWELRDAQGRILDQTTAINTRDVCRLHLLLGHSVVGTHVTAPTSFALTFNTGLVFGVFDDSEQYESCQLSPSGVVI